MNCFRACELTPKSKFTVHHWLLPFIQIVIMWYFSDKKTTKYVDLFHGDWNHTISSPISLYMGIINSNDTHWRKQTNFLRPSHLTSWHEIRQIQTTFECVTYLSHRKQPIGEIVDEKRRRKSVNFLYHTHEISLRLNLCKLVSWRRGPEKGVCVCLFYLRIQFYAQIQFYARMPYSCNWFWIFFQIVFIT